METDNPDSLESIWDNVELEDYLGRTETTATNWVGNCLWPHLIFAPHTSNHFFSDSSLFLTMKPVDPNPVTISGFWKRVDVKTNDMPCPRENNTLFILKGWVYFFGGHNGQMLNDFYMLGSKGMTWLENLNWFEMYQGWVVELWEDNIVTFGGGKSIQLNKKEKVKYL